MVKVNGQRQNIWTRIKKTVRQRFSVTDAAYTVASAFQRVILYWTGRVSVITTYFKKHDQTFTVFGAAPKSGSVPEKLDIGRQS